MGAEEMVKNVHLPEEGHGYELPKRKAVYPFLARHLDLKLKAILDESGEISEETIVIEPYEQMNVFSAENPRPANAVLTNDEVTW